MCVIAFPGDFNARTVHIPGILSVAHFAVLALIVIYILHVNCFQETGQQSVYLLGNGLNARGLNPGGANGFFLLQAFQTGIHPASCATHAHTPNVMLPHHHIDFLHF